MNPSQQQSNNPQPNSSQSANLNYALWADRALAAFIDIGISFAFMIVLFIVMIFVVPAVSAAISGIMIGIAEIIPIQAIAELFAGLATVVTAIASFVTTGSCCLSIFLPPISYFLVGFVNKVYWVSNRGYSIGQGAMNLRVVNQNGDFISWATAFSRLLCQVGLAFFPFIGPFFDLVYPLFDDPTRQTLHDKAVGTYVIKEQ